MAHPHPNITVNSEPVIDFPELERCKQDYSKSKHYNVSKTELTEGEHPRRDKGQLKWFQEVVWDMLTE